MAYAGERPTQPESSRYRTGQSYTGVNEQMIGQRPGIVKQTVQLSYGVYKTQEVKLYVGYHGYTAFDEDCEKPDEEYKVTITLPDKWMDNPTPVTALKKFFQKAYARKRPGTPLAKAEEWDLAIKDESMFKFSKKLVDDDAIITQIFYERQEIYAMLPVDWEQSEAELKKARKIITDGLAHTHRNVKHSPDTIIPVLTKKQIIPGQTYLLLTGWYKQQCVIVQPEHTVADVKFYLHEKNGPRMPMEALDIGVRRDDDIKILDDALTLQEVFELAQKKWDTDGNILAAPEPEKPAPAPPVLTGAAAAAAGTGDGDVEEWDERQGWKDGKAPPGPDDIVLDTDDNESGAPKDEEAIAALAALEEEKVPTFMGKAMIVGVGKRIQDVKHRIWLPSVHDPYSFRTPADQAPAGGTKDEFSVGYNGSAPRGWSGSEASPSVNQDENCSIM